MKPLDKALRNQLEKTVRDAREAAETAAKKALEQLGVGEANPFPHLTEDERDLRRKLQVHGRQLGDSLDGEKTQTMERLIEEVAYEHWHRMLFARFLAENNLLMYPDAANSVPVTLEECKDLAAKEGAKNGWELAARFAAHMLPQIFRPNSPVFQLSLLPEDQQKLEHLLDDLPVEIFTASDSVGWVYQFWQAKKKDEVNASEMKIGARELPAVTQLFTEPYMVNFLLDNSLGAWWSSRKLTENDSRNAKNEEELRLKASLPGVPLEYLRFMKKDGLWSPTTGNFEEWPQHLGKLKTLDPCCGSGHFLASAFLMLVPMRMELEGLSARKACDAVLEENLYGLEIDQRCVELSAFALALTAWKYPGAGGYRKLPEFQIAWCGQSVNIEREDWLALAENDPDLRLHLDRLYTLFQDAPILGSLLNPMVSFEKGSLFANDWERIVSIIKTKFTAQKTDENSLGIIVYGMEKAFQLLGIRYQWIITNVPYLGAGKQSEKLLEYGKKNYDYADNDLATVFLARCLDYCSSNGNVTIVLPQNWLFLSSYKRLREHLLSRNTWKSIAWLGPGAFDSISGEVVKAILLIIGKAQPQNTANFIGVDVSTFSGPKLKASRLVDASISPFSQLNQLRNPKSIISSAEISAEKLLSKYMTTSKGICTGDSARFTQYFWEQPRIANGWVNFRTSVNETVLFSGMENILFWQNGDGELIKYVKERLNDNISAWIRGNAAWGKRGISVSRVSGLSATIYTGELFDDNAAILIPNDQTDLEAIWTYCSSGNFEKDVRKINQKLSVDNEYLKLISFEVDYWRTIAKEKYPLGLPKPYSKDPTQWVFHGNPIRSDHQLQVAVVRLLGYRWPAELDSKMELSDEANSCVKKTNSLLSFADEDGVVCIPSVRGEVNAEDRLENLLAATFGAEWSPAKKSELLAKADYAGKTLESWLREKFFIQHCKLFHDRPFIWHIWDGLNDGFAALVNYHKLDYKLLETLIYTYLGDWISQQKQDKARGVDGAEGKLAAAEGLKKRLELILDGKEPYDIFVRWKPIEEQPIGWNPDLNDGVRVNIRPFMSVPDVGKKGAGVLRDKPNINWGKDRGRDVGSSSWFKLGPVHGGHEGDRINDHHLSISEKKAAAEKSGSK